MFRTLLDERQSVREYEQRPVEQEKLRYIVECALKAPTARNDQGCFYHILTDRKMIERISRAGKQNGEKYVNFEQLYSNLKIKYNENDPLFYEAPALIIMTQPENHTISGGIQSMALLLGAQEVGLRTCCIGLARFAWEEIKQVINVPDGHSFGLAYTVGYSNAKPEPKIKDLNKLKFY
ncbi:MAG: hypothetical protein EZS28_038217 [Streblomastix strix]|uniref:Nitroreductase domain-containing protein n=1 Tax=Streblomastix strix TaxID=222440 RepID=A0A5J4U980_9EUKA|nr:MAG: hypothetical protein EZS28_038217 [Streblomastix strix]